MPAIDAGPTRARHLFIEHEGMLRTSNAIRLAFSHEPCMGFGTPAKSNKLGGASTNSPLRTLSSPNLVPIAIRVPRAVICITSAIAHHGLPHRSRAQSMSVWTRASLPSLNRAASLPLRERGLDGKVLPRGERLNFSCNRIMGKSTCCAPTRCVIGLSSMAIPAREADAGDRRR
jgi:hypothetical protein